MASLKIIPADVPRIAIPKTLSYLLAFLLLEFTCMQAHELIHHLTGRLVCGAWGTMTFNLFYLAPECFETKKIALLSTFAGPALSYFLMWAGMLLVLKNRGGLFGLSLIFANLPFARFISVVMARGDEMLIGRRLIGEGAYPLVLGAVVLILLPPLLVAQKAIANKRRWSIFLSFLLLTLAYDALTKRVLLAPLIDRWELFASNVFGIPLFIVCVDVAVLLALACFSPDLYERKKLGRPASNGRVLDKSVVMQNS
ncbi:MAG TPA: hypothetical protein VGW12_01570 [Pyrinomonadaceae bacterium]|nr:hypothetical protein [Pyrinomonadaceae bacterium]